MDFINRIDNAFAWMKSGGIYRQVDLYHRGETLFAKWGGGYVRLSVSGSTSVPKVTWMEIDPGDVANIDARDGHIPVYKGNRRAKIKAA